MTDDGGEHTELLELAELPEKNPGPVCRLERDGTVLMANAAARRFIGQGDIRGQCWIDLCPGMTWEVWQRVLDTDPGSDVHVLHEAERDGTCILFTHVRSASGELVFAYGADITVRRRDEQLLAEQVAMLAEVARFPEMNPGPVLRLDSDANVLMANAAARQVFGSELVGRCWHALCPGVDKARFAEVRATDQVIPLEARIGDRHFVFAHRYDARTDLVFVFGADVTAQKLAERALRQAEKMATLGTLSAGIAHELNNPAAAARRAAEQLQDAFSGLEAAYLALGSRAPDLEMLRVLDARARDRAQQPSDLGTLERADREADVENWLDDHDVDEAWDLAAPLVAQGLDPDSLDGLLAAVGEEHLAAAVTWAASVFRVHMLTHEIGQGAARISEIVGALKGYSYLGQGPVQAVDLHAGLDNTLVILRNKLKAGVEVTRDYETEVPLIPAYGSELNQVWTNIIDNAVDAMNGSGTITITTRRESDHVTVVICDDGPGIPEDIQRSVFDPFFTTKAPGKGTGLGLSTSYSIVTEKHGGTLTLESQPGRTCFTVRLPMERSNE